jgi:uncharacterized spore protein YtfJ
MASDKIEKLSYNDGMMLEKLVDSINQLIEMVEYLDKRMDRHWQYHRMKEKEDRDKG